MMVDILLKLEVQHNHDELILRFFKYINPKNNIIVMKLVFKTSNDNVISAFYATLVTCAKNSMFR